LASILTRQIRRWLSGGDYVVSCAGACALECNALAYAAKGHSSRLYAPLRILKTGRVSRPFFQFACWSLASPPLVSKSLARAYATRER
jgi:hypothetical protein